MRLVTNQVVTGVAAIGSHRVRAAVFNADQEAYAQITGALPSAVNEGEYSVYARITDPGAAGMVDGYAFSLQPVVWRLHEFTNGVCTVLAEGPWPLSGGMLPFLHVQSKSLTIAVNEYLWLRCEGTTIQGFVTDLTIDKEVFTVTDAAHNNAGQIGIRVRTGGSAWDNFGGGNL